MRRLVLVLALGTSPSSIGGSDRTSSTSTSAGVSPSCVGGSDRTTSTSTGGTRTSPSTSRVLVLAPAALAAAMRRLVLALALLLAPAASAAATGRLALVLARAPCDD
jgi:hypothetical protein